MIQYVWLINSGLVIAKCEVGFRWISNAVACQLEVDPVLAVKCVRRFSQDLGTVALHPREFHAHLDDAQASTGTLVMRCIVLGIDVFFNNWTGAIVKPNSGRANGFALFVNKPHAIALRRHGNGNETGGEIRNLFGELPQRVSGTRPGEGHVLFCTAIGQRFISIGSSGDSQLRAIGRERH
jgi:hypothetical protein